MDVKGDAKMGVPSCAVLFICKDNILFSNENQC